MHDALYDQSKDLGFQPAKVDRKFYTPAGKRIVDLFLAFMMLPVLAPVIFALFVVAKKDGGPGFFGHKRVGRNGRIFRCWKIRTMVVDAEEKLKTYLAQNPDAAEEWARDHKLTDDPRITRVGKFLRETSLDELPQLWNVIKGEMSFVGARPVVQAELEKYGADVDAYYAQKPGITGLWQVSGRNDVSYEERVQMDVSYLNRCSLWTDLKIIVCTGLEVVGKSGR